MNKPRLELADVFRSLDLDSLEESGTVLSAAQRRVLRDITQCRTAALGGHLGQCDQCGHQQIAYNSCRNRHCPKCQAAARAKWLDERAADLLGVCLANGQKTTISLDDHSVIHSSGTAEIRVILGRRPKVSLASMNYRRRKWR